jgi:hypothetical protein
MVSVLREIRSIICEGKYWRFRFLLVIPALFPIFSACDHTEELPVCVDSYGAVGDGITDDKTAIQNCLNANPGKIILFTKGKNYLADNLIVPEYTTIRGTGSKITGQSGDNVLNLHNFCRVEGIEIDGNDKCYNGIKMDAVCGVTVSACYVHNAVYCGINENNASDNSILNNIIELCPLGIGITFGDNCKINFNKITINKIDTIYNCSTGIKAWGFWDIPSNRGITNLTVDHNIITTDLPDHNQSCCTIWGTTMENVHFTNNTCIIEDGQVSDYNMGMENTIYSDFTGNDITNGANAGIAIYNDEGGPGFPAGSGKCDYITLRNNIITYNPGAVINASDGSIACIRSFYCNNGPNITFINNIYKINRTGVSETYCF